MLNFYNNLKKEIVEVQMSICVLCLVSLFQNIALELVHYLLCNAMEMKIKKDNIIVR